MMCRALVLADLVLLKVRHAEAFAHEACPRVSRYMTNERIDCNRYPLRWSVSLHFTPGRVANLRVGHRGFSVFKESTAAL
uniref:Putative secreted protein n=1 Tax=Anopheles marajoara TaxID=58244 RepID=A0A2M4CCX4_9DIPT